MDKPIAEVIFGIAVVVLAAIVIIWGTTQVRGNIEKADKASAQMDTATETLLESEYTIYEASEKTGSSIINLISRHEQEGTKICIEVDNGSGSYTQYCYNKDLTAKADAKVVNAKNKSDLTTYINPKAPFLGHVVRDEATGAIIGLQFKNNINGNATFD